MNRIKISKSLIIINLLLMSVFTQPEQPECQIQALKLKIFDCTLQYCRLEDNTIQIKSCTSDLFSTQYADDQNIMYFGNFGNCIRYCCVRSDNPPAPVTQQFLSQCNIQNQNFEILGEAPYFVFIFFVALIVCWMICRWLKLRSLQRGTCQNKVREFIIKYFCCCLNQGVSQNRQPHQENPSLQVFNFNCNQINSEEQLFKEQDNLFEINDGECAICLQSLPNSVTACGHKFHTNCIRQWKKRDRHCPLCKNQRVTPIKVYCNICFVKCVRVDGRNFDLNKKLYFFIDKVCISCGRGKNHIQLQTSD